MDFKANASRLSDYFYRHGDERLVGLTQKWQHLMAEAEPSQQEVDDLTKELQNESGSAAVELYVNVLRWSQTRWNSCRHPNPPTYKCPECGIFFIKG